MTASKRRANGRDEPPHSVEAEQATLGSLLLDPAAWREIAETLQADDFYRPDHRLIFEAIGALARAGGACDAVTVSEELKRTAKLDAAGGLAYLSTLARDTPTAANICTYAQILRERARLRRWIEFGRSIESRVINGASAADLTQDLEREVSRLKDGQHPDTPPPIAGDELAGRDPPEREWVIPYWIPAGHLTLLSGRGGIGKTLLGQLIGSAVALGHEFIEPLASRRVLMWAAEDDEAELWRRQERISSWIGKPMAELTDRFVLYSFYGKDVTLAAPVSGVLTPTVLMELLRWQVRYHQPDVVILDNIARIYGGSENDRHSVTTFCALVQGVCAPAAVILLGHPAKTAGSEYAGSTAWEAAARARLYLSDRPPDQDPDDGEPADERVRYLARRKANYSALDLRRFTFADGVLIPDSIEPAKFSGPGGPLVEDIVRRAAQKLGERGVYGSACTAAQTYLPRLAKEYGLLDLATEKAFAKAMRKMILDGQLVSREVGRYPNRSPRMGLVIP